MINKTILIGNLGKDPETRQFDNGNKVVNFSLATTRKYNNKQGEKVDTTQWHNIVIFGKQAEIAEKYLSKGSKIYLEGEIQYREYEDKEGIKRRITDIQCFNFQMLDSKKQDNAGQPRTTQDTSRPKADETDTDDFPF